MDEQHCFLEKKQGLKPAGLRPCKLVSLSFRFKRYSVFRPLIYRSTSLENTPAARILPRVSLSSPIHVTNNNDSFDVINRRFKIIVDNYYIFLLNIFNWFNPLFKNKYNLESATSLIAFQNLEYDSKNKDKKKNFGTLMYSGFFVSLSLKRTGWKLWYSLTNITYETNITEQSSI